MVGMKGTGIHLAGLPNHDRGIGKYCCGEVAGRLLSLTSLMWEQENHRTRGPSMA